jgi:hypothetical protein
MLGGAAFSGAHSMPRESSMPGEAASFRGTQHAQGELHARGSSMLRGTHHVEGEQHSRRSSMLRGTHHAWGSSMPGDIDINIDIDNLFPRHTHRAIL